jgi:hypothetical protein
VTGPEQIDVGVSGPSQVIQHSGHNRAMSAFEKRFFDRGGGKPLDP